MRIVQLFRVAVHRALNRLSWFLDRVCGSCGMGCRMAQIKIVCVQQGYHWSVHHGCCATYVPFRSLWSDELRA